MCKNYYNEWKRSFKIIGFLLLLVLSFVSCSPVQGATMPDIQMDEPRANVMLTYSEFSKLTDNLNELATISSAQKARMQKLELALETSSMSMSESSQALMKAHEQTKKQEEQLKNLNGLLENQKLQLEEATNSLQIAQRYSSELEQSLKREKKRNNKNKWLLAVAGATAIYFAAK